LQDEIRTEQQEENKQKGDIHQRHKGKPPEGEVYRAVKLHEAGAVCRFNESRASGIKLRLGPGRLFRLLKADDAADRTAFS